MMARVDGRSGDELLDAAEALPAARPLLARLDGIDGVYLVGGAVRDLLLGAAPVDLDLVVEGDLSPVSARLGPPDRAHDRFGTSTISLAGFDYDLARARTESYDHGGALPTVTPATIEDDLRRRDFTVNALALGLTGRRRGELIAVPGALEDLGHRRLRILHDASFRDDPTRLLRLARYGARLGFAPEPHTAALAAAALRGRALETVSGPRIGAELRLLADEDDPIAGFCALRALGIDRAIAPGFGLADPAAAKRALALLPTTGDRGAVVLGAAGLGVAPPTLRVRLDELAFPAARRETIAAAAARAPALARALRAAPRPSEIAAAVAGAPVEMVALAGGLGAPEPARRWLHELRDVRLAIDGGDLVAAGIAPGPAIGAALRAALAAKLDGGVDGAREELGLALRVAAGEG
jgi:tRNA nucleotidyltransferase (CCA-adding enzyme)